MEFGIENNILKKALEGGIRVKKGAAFVDAPGFLSLTYIKQWGAYVLAFGHSSADAGHVRVDAYGRDWVLKDAG